MKQLTDEQIKAVMDGLYELATGGTGMERAAGAEALLLWVQWIEGREGASRKGEPRIRRL